MNVSNTNLSLAGSSRSATTRAQCAWGLSYWAAYIQVSNHDQLLSYTWQVNNNISSILNTSVDSLRQQTNTSYIQQGYCFRPCYTEYRHFCCLSDPFHFKSYNEQKNIHNAWCFVLYCWASDEMEKFWQTNLLTFCRFRSVFTFAQVHYSLSQTQFLLQRKYQHLVLQSHLWAFTCPILFV